MSQREYDVVVMGATGFTGRLVAEYLASRAGEEVRWAIAGRNQGKLLEVQQSLRTKAPAPILIADVADPTSLDRLAASTKVVLTTVGPYVRFGEPVVRACVEQGTDYVDITGDPEFVDKMWAAYDDPARAKGVRIVNCCGFDSIPHDLGALFTVLQLPDDQPIRLRGFVSAKGMFSGGTWHSAINAMANARTHLQWRRQHPTPRATDGRRVRLEKPRVHYEESLQAWAAPLPTIDPDIVRRSAIARPEYGPDFRYGHYARIRRLTTVVAGGMGIGAIAGLAQLGPTRRALLKLRNPGEGPPERQRKRNWFEVRFVGEAGNGEIVLTKVNGGDPGYTETAKMAAESALCLAFDGDALPDAAGVLTTAVAMGEALIERLQRAGIQFTVVGPRQRGARAHDPRPALQDRPS